jgi:hypothetical protein
MASFPAQNGQGSDRAESFLAPIWRGRLSLSEAMMTERPVTGSFLNSDMEKDAPRQFTYGRWYSRKTL